MTFGFLFRLLFCFSFLIALPSFSASSVLPPICDATELVERNDNYNHLVCDGIELYKAKHYRDASVAFEAALREPLFEYPNYKVLPILALAYSRAGDMSKAISTLRKAELSLSILIGSLRCVETKTGFDLIGEPSELLQYKERSEVIKNMCGAEYEYVYKQRSLYGYLRDSKLIEAYFSAKNEIQPEKRGSNK